MGSMRLKQLLAARLRPASLRVLVQTMLRGDSLSMGLSEGVPAALVEHGANMMMIEQGAQQPEGWAQEVPVAMRTPSLEARQVGAPRSESAPREWLVVQPTDCTGLVHWCYCTLYIAFYTSARIPAQRCG